MSGGWRLAVRIARRTVRRHLWRSVLIAALVAVPIAGATVTDGILRTRLDPDAGRYDLMGRADALVTLPGSVDIAGVLPAGSRAKVVRTTTDEWSPVQLAAGDLRVQTEIHVADAGDALTEHVLRLSSGRLPRAADEVLLSERLAEQLGLLAGGRLRPAATATVLDGPTIRITGLIAYRNCELCAAAIAAPGSVLAGGESPLRRVEYAVDVPAGTTDEQLRSSVLTLADADLTTRESYTEPWTFGEQVWEYWAWFVPFAGLGLLEILLLAGAGFAVGARRQVRELGLIAANGGTVTQLSKVMLAQGLVLGVLGAVGGILLGAIVAVLGMPLWQRWFPGMSDDLRFGWPELAIVGSAGVLACVVAAVVPAIGAARMRPVDALAGRFRTTSPTTRLPVLGLVLLLVGGTGTVLIGIMGRAQLDTHLPTSVQSMSLLIVGGTAIMVLGFVLVTPVLVALAGRLSARLPLSGRVAVRDAGRHRHRTVAAVGAVMIAVAGAVATAFVFKAEAHNQRDLPDNTIHLMHGWASDGPQEQQEQLDWAVTRLTDKLPDAKAHQVTALSPAGTQGSSPIGVSPPVENDNGECGWQTLGTPEAFSTSAGRAPDAGVRAALAAGKVVVFDECMVSSHGTVVAELDTGPVQLPAYVASRAPKNYAWLPGAFISPQAAETYGWRPYVDSVLVTYAATADQNEVKNEVDIVFAAGVGVGVDEDESAGLGGKYLWLAGGSALIALLGVAATVALAGAEGRVDMATLAALGAQPRRRRTLAAAHALVISGLGTPLGILLGGCVGYAVIPMGFEPSFAPPWQLIGLIMVGVPCVAALVATLTTRSRLPMLQRRGS